MATNVIKQDSTTILNGMRDVASPYYTNLVPIATPKNIAQIGDVITHDMTLMEEFIAIATRIGMVITKSMYFENPLKRFKKGMIEYGTSIEEIFVQIAEAQDWSWDDVANENPFSKTIPDVQANFHSLNVRKQLKTTTTEEMLTNAFLSETGVADLIQKIVESLTTGLEVYEFEQMLGLVGDAYTNGDISKLEVNISDTATKKENNEELLVDARRMATNLSFPATTYNKNGVLNTTRKDKLVIIMTSALEASVDVLTLAGAFNMDKAEFLGSRVVIPAFPEGMEDVQALMVSEDWFMIYDKMLRMESIRNPKGLYYNWFLTYQGIYSYSNFENAVALVKPAAPSTGEDTEGEVEA